MGDFDECVMKTTARSFFSKLQENYNGGWGLFIWGANGVGKTHLSCALLKEIQKTGYSTYCIPADALKVAYIEPKMFDEDNTILSRVRPVDFLLLEDLGKEYSGKGSGFAELCFENLIRERSRELRPTIVTTNLDPASFKARYQNSAASLAMECMIAIEMKGSDRRAKLAQDKKQDYK
jgi:DNA replication protein DnaC